MILPVMNDFQYDYGRSAPAFVRRIVHVVDREQERLSGAAKEIVQFWHLH